MVSVIGSETEAKGGHAVSAWSQSTLSVLEHEKKKKKGGGGRKNKAFGFTFDQSIIRGRKR